MAYQDLSKGLQVGSRSPGVIDAARARAGQLQTVGPLRFRQDELERCSAKCLLRFTDQEGSVIIGIFFKEAFYGELVQMEGSVRLTGVTKLQGQQLQILIQDIQ